MGATGEELAGENLNGRISISQTYNGAPDAVDTAADYSITSDNSSRENTGFETVSYRSARASGSNSQSRFRNSPVPISLPVRSIQVKPSKLQKVPYRLETVLQI